MGEMPGMGGFDSSVNFRNNCSAWQKLKNDYSDFLAKTKRTAMPEIRLAPITGGVENVGYADEKLFYSHMINAAYSAGFLLSLGDGCPDEKIRYGIEAVSSLAETEKNGKEVKAAVFMKPYPNEKLFERMEWAEKIMEYCGVDIDSYNIVTMRNLVKLEKKNAAQMQELKKRCKVPFAIKGVFTDADVELVKEVKPDVVVISNHGGRVENRIGSTADFLVQKGEILRNNCGELWIDGGIRTEEDIALAGYLGASQVMVGRPVITALCKGGEKSVKECFSRLKGLNP